LHFVAAFLSIACLVVANLPRLVTSRKGSRASGVIAGSPAVSGSVATAAVAASAPSATGSVAIGSVAASGVVQPCPAVVNATVAALRTGIAVAVSPLSPDASVPPCSSPAALTVDAPTGLAFRYLLVVPVDGMTPGCLLLMLLGCCFFFF